MKTPSSSKSKVRQESQDTGDADGVDDETTRLQGCLLVAKDSVVIEWGCFPVLSSHNASSAGCVATPEGGSTQNHGRSWRELNPVDGSDEYAVMYARNLLTREGVKYAGVWSRPGNSLYVSSDNGLSWRRRRRSTSQGHAVDAVCRCSIGVHSGSVRA